MLRQNKIHVLKIIFCFILTIGVLPPFTLFLDANAQNESNEFISEEQSYVLKEKEDFCFSESSSSDSETNEYTNVDVPKESTNNELDKELSNGDYEDDTTISSEEFTEEESSEESATNTEMNQYQSNSNETYGCAYFLNESVGVYKSNYLYFYGYEIDELEKASSVDKAIKCKWKNIHEDIPKEIKSSILCVVFDQSSKNIKPDNLNSAFTSFSNCEAFEGLNYLDTSLVKDISYMFNGCSTIKHLDLTSFNLSNVENMSTMFSHCFSIRNIIFSKNAMANKVVNIYYFCCYCSKLETIILPSFNDPSIVDMARMFAYCNELKNIDFSDFDSSNVTNMECLFYQCYKLEYLDLSFMKTSNVNNSYSMFAFCKSLKLLNISEFDISNEVNIDNMFYMCSNLKTIYVKKNFGLNPSKYNRTLFDGCISLVGGAGTAYYYKILSSVAACVDRDINGTWGIDKGYFTGDTVVVDFYANGVEGAPPASAMCDLNSEFVLPDKGELIPPSGLGFAGWAVGDPSEEVKQPGETISINAYTPIYAVWNKIYSVTLETNGGKIAEGCNVSSYIYGVGAKLPGQGEISRVRYTFKGWFDNVGLLGNPIESISKTDIDNKKYWARWDANHYKVSFNGNAPVGSSVIDVPGSVDATYGAELPALSAVPKCQGYKFDGFYYREGEIEKQYYQADGNPVDGVTWDIASDVELIAKWLPFDDPTNSNECLYDSENITETGDYNTCLPALVFFNTLLLITLTILLVSSLFSCLKNLRNF